LVKSRIHYVIGFAEAPKARMGIVRASFSRSLGFDLARVLFRLKPPIESSWHAFDLSDIAFRKGEG
jgi:hypothetical protein